MMSKDTIYRQDAINTLADMHCKSDEDGYVWIIRSDAWARIDALPSAQPERKKRKWIPVHDNNGLHLVCEFCGEWKYHTFQKYCGECGADMIGGE